ncbi:MAG: PKD domain-containing protein, partial [Williamsia herbipolensis]|nr:PKD domain-containing protein [Williamsia herbipolensis]
GTFTVTLTVTDDKGATDTVSHDVTVVTPNSPPTAAFTATAHKLTTAFDGTGSTDADGTVASWAWTFGDGTSGAGSTVNHQYPRAGTYTATLTVTDDRGATSSTTKNVTVAANVAPSASFTASTNALTVSVDASASTDPDGTIASYAWDFGDRTTGTGATVNHTYGTAGTYTIGLTVTDDDGTTASTTRTVTVAPSNQPPVATFTSSASGLTVNFDASASNDPDGSIDSYSWDFGDTGKANGVKPSHTYAAAGTYTVSLTVLDNRGGATSTTQQVSVTAPPQNVIAQDAFGRTTAGGWGSADTGGAWALTGTAANFSVGGGVGRIAAPASGTRTALLSGVSSADADVTVTASLDAVPTGGGEYVKVIPRQVGAANYTAQAWVKSNGSVTLLLQQGSTVLKQFAVPGLTVSAGSKIRIHVRVSGSAPSTLQANVWADGSPEPAGWQASVTDSTGPQGAGSVGVQTYLSGSATSPVTVSFDDFAAQRVGATPPVNSAPTASFTSTTADLVASFDGTGSTDSDGTVAGWSWAFGDGTSGTGSKVSHTFGAAGTYTVTLTVTDDKGATGTVSHPVTVTAPAGAPLASDAFARTTANGWGTADAGGAWTVNGTAANWRTDGASGLVSVGAGITRTGTLSSVSSSSTDSTVSFTTDVAPTGGGTFVSVVGRSTAAGNYQARVWLTSAGGVQLQLLGKTQLAAANIAGLTFQPGTVLDVRFQVSGSSPTT